MVEWAQNIAQSNTGGMLLFAAVFLLGAISAVGSTCNIAAIAAIAGYASAKDNQNKSELWATGLGFSLGTLLALAVIGIVIGLAGEITNPLFKTGARLFFGLFAVVFGLFSLNLLPIKIPAIKIMPVQENRSMAGSLIFGFSLGGATLSCTLACCSPVLPLIMGVSFTGSQGIKSMMLMLCFGIGHILPLLALLTGLSAGMLTQPAATITVWLKRVGGVLLIGVGFYLLATL
jgi:cytochrome c biogenesis protein CcdA